MLKRVRNISSIILLVFLLVVCVLPGLVLLKSGANTVSNKENRRLAALPALPRDQKSLLAWPTGFEDFVTDHFGFRSKLVSGYNYLHVRLGVSPLKRVMVGEDGWLFLEQTRLSDANRGALPINDADLARLTSSFAHRQRYLARMQKKLVVFPAPDKNTLYPEFLPDSVKRVGPSRFMQFRSASQQADFPTVDTLSALQTAKHHGENTYFKTGSHWNCRGAWFAYLALMDTIRAAGYQGGRVLDESEVEFLKPDKFPGGDITRNLLNLGGQIPEPFAYTCRIRKPSKFKVIRPSDGTSFTYPYAAPPGQEHRLYRHRQATDGSRVLIYRDSYANAMVPFLIESFDVVIYASPGVKMGFDPADIDRYNPDLLIYEFVERTLFYPPNDKLLNDREQRSDKR